MTLPPGKRIGPFKPGCQRLVSGSIVWPPFFHRRVHPGHLGISRWGNRIAKGYRDGPERLPVSAPPCDLGVPRSEPPRSRSWPLCGENHSSKACPPTPSPRRSPCPPRIASRSASTGETSAPAPTNPQQRHEQSHHRRQHRSYVAPCRPVHASTSGGSLEKGAPVPGDSASTCPSGSRGWVSAFRARGLIFGPPKYRGMNS